MIFHWYEIPNNINTYAPVNVSMPLRVAFVPWSVIGALGLTGMIFTIRNTKSLNLLIGILSQVAVMIAFYVLCRFRVPMVAMMAVYAGYVLQALINAPVKRKLLLAVVSIAMWLIIVRPYPKIDLTFSMGELSDVFQHLLP
jgi:hypothetical protein